MNCELTYHPSPSGPLLDTHIGQNSSVMTQTAFALFLLFLKAASASSNQLSVPSNTRCACSGDVLTFECTLVGSSHTIWTGIAFDCGNSNNEILLSNRNDGVIKSCSNGAIVGRITAVDDNCFTSQLNVTAAATFNNKTVQCVRSSDEEVIGQSMVTVVSATNPYPPPNVINLVNINREQVTFNWTSLSPPCSTIEYIISSDCGVCPPSTGSPTVTCTGFQLPTNLNDIECSFTVNSRVCGITSDLSTAIVLRVPEIPSIKKIVPVYLNDSKELKRLLITLSVEAIGNTDDVSGDIAVYTITFTSRSSRTAVNLSIDADSGSCDVTTCTYTVDVPQDICMSSSNFIIALSARNSVGQGFPSDAINIGCTNEFVMLYFNATTSNFTCVFTSGIDNSERFCSIQFRRGGQEPSRSVQGRSTNASVVSLNLGDIADGMYSFIVSASSGVASVQIEGDFRIGSTATISPAIAAVAVVPVVIIGVVVVGVCLKVAYSRHRKRTYKDLQPGEKVKPTEKVDNNPLRDIKPVKVPENEAREFNLFAVQSDCSQREAMSVMKFAGDIYYELTDEKEDIFNYKVLMFTSEKKFPKIEQIDSPPVGFSATNPSAVEVIPLTQVQVTEQFSLCVFASDVDSKALLARGLIGEGITRQAFGNKYRVFVKSEASGTRHLGRGTCILYKELEQDQERDYPLLPLPDDYLAVCNIRDDTTLRKFYKDHHIEVYRNKANTCLELSDQIDLKDDNIQDIVLMDKEGRLFTGPGARKMLRGEGLDEKYKHMNVFVLGVFDGNHKLKSGTSVLYENPGHKISTLCMVKVDKDNVRMSKFVKEKTGGYEKGQVFYEFTEKEDLPYCRKVLRITEGQFSKAERKETQKFHASIEVFYSSLTPGAPGMNVSPPVSEHGTRIFIHDPTQGYRCLKKGTYLLYKCEDPKNGNDYNNNNNPGSIDQEFSVDEQ